MSYPSTSFVTLSRNGRFAVFSSAANNLVAGDTNRVADVFVRDLQTGSVVCVSAPNGSDLPVGGTAGVISDDGRYAVFLSGNLSVAAAPSSGTASLFLRDLTNHATTAIAKTNAGALAAADYQFSMSADGRLTAFQTSSKMMPGQTDSNKSIFVYDRNSATLTRITTVPNDSSYRPTLSANGSFLSFVSTNSQLVTGDTNNAADVFLKDMNTSAVTRVSVADDGSQANGASGSNTYCSPSVSDDGRYVIFASSATNLLPGTTVTRENVYLRDTLDGHTYCLSVSPAGVPLVGGSPTLSADGRYASFTSSSPDILPGNPGTVTCTYVLDRAASTLRRLSVTPTGDARTALYPWIAADGARAAFVSNADDLVDGDTNRSLDAFVADTGTGQLARVSEGPEHHERGGGYCQAPAISADGRFVFYWAWSANLAPVGDSAGGAYRHDRLTGQNRKVTSYTFVGASADGRYVAAYGQKPNTGGTYDASYYLWVIDIDAGSQTIASLAADGSAVKVDTLSPMGISGDGGRVLFTPTVPFGSSEPKVLYQRDLVAGTTAQVNTSESGTAVGFGSDQPLPMSADGRFVAFYSGRETGPAETPTYFTTLCVKDTLTGVLTEAAVVSVRTTASAPAPRQHSQMDRLNMSANGRFVVFSSNMDTLVANDTSGQSANCFSGTDVFVYDRVTSSIARASVASDGTQANDLCCLPSISDDGRFVAFVSSATNLVPNHPVATADVYIRDMVAGKTFLASARPDGNAADGWSGANAYTTPGTSDVNGSITVSDEHSSAISVVGASGAISTTTRSGSMSGIALSGNGQWVAYLSRATDLVPGDTNDAVDVFVTGPLQPFTGTTIATVAKALRVYAGLEVAEGLSILNADTSGPSAVCIDMADAIALCRQVDPATWTR